MAQGCWCNGKQYSYDYSSKKADKISHPHLCGKFKAKLGPHFIAKDLWEE